MNKLYSLLRTDWKYNSQILNWEQLPCKETTIKVYLGFFSALLNTRYFSYLFYVCVGCSGFSIN